MVKFSHLISPLVSIVGEVVNYLLFVAEPLLYSSFLLPLFPIRPLGEEERPSGDRGERSRHESCYRPEPYVFLPAALWLPTYGACEIEA